jgi:hypothetical protein
MSWVERARAQVKCLFAARCVEATHRAPKRSFLLRFLSCCGLFGGHRQRQGLTVGLNPNQQLAMYLHWMFRVNFVFLFLVMCVCFFALVIIFSGFITLAGTLDAECVRIGGYNFKHAETPFADAVRITYPQLHNLSRLVSVHTLDLCFIPFIFSLPFPGQPFLRWVMEARTPHLDFRTQVQPTASSSTSFVRSNR